MIQLATRGYLWMLGVGGAQIFGPGPVIANSESVQPELKGSAYLAPPGPGIVGAGVAAPAISGSSSTPTTLPATPPSISGGGPMKPRIGK
jgi:hypothetical protein